jgi:glycine/D-amino acid oxidase-like deaminating enzyme
MTYEQKKAPKGPVWIEEASKEDYPKLAESPTTEVVIIGGGLAGVISAYLLAKAGKKVVLLEKSELGGGATEYTTAFLTQSIDTDFSDLIKTFGKDAAKKVVDSHQSAIDLIEKIAADENINCDFMRCQNITYALSERDYKTLEDEYDAAKELGIKISKEPSHSKLPFKNYGYIAIDNQAKFHPLKFLYSVAAAAKKYGAEIYEQTEVKEIEQLDDGRVQVTTRRGTVQADWAIVTTYEPFNKPLRLYFKKAFYESYVFELEIPPAIIPEAIYEDTDNPYNYFRVDRADGGKDRVIVGGQDHRSDIKVHPSKNFKALEDYIKDTFGHIEYKITRKWRGPILEPVDGLAFIGSMSHDRILYAMAFSGNGMTYSGIAAQIFADTIRGVENEYAQVYRAERIPKLKALMVKGRDYGEELIRGAAVNVVKYRKDR